MKLILHILLFISFSCYSQSNELYDIVFSNKANFDVLKAFGNKIPSKYIILSTTQTWDSTTFYLNNIDLKNPLVLDKIIKNEYHPYHYSYLFSNKLLDEKISMEEKIFLAEKSKKIIASPIDLKGKNYYTSKISSKKGFYFSVSDPIYTSSNDYAFLYLVIKQKYKVQNEEWIEKFATLTFMFQKNSQGKWDQIGIKQYLVL